MTWEWRREVRRSGRARLARGSGGTTPMTRRGRDRNALTGGWRRRESTVSYCLPWPFPIPVPIVCWLLPNSGRRPSLVQSAHRLHRGGWHRPSRFGNIVMRRLQWTWPEIAGSTGLRGISGRRAALDESDRTARKRFLAERSLVGGAWWTSWAAASGWGDMGTQSPREAPPRLLVQDADCPSSKWPPFR
jgi:hypothetical protein